MVTQKRQAVVALEAIEVATAISFECYKGAQPLALGNKKTVEKIADAKGKTRVIEVPVIWMVCDPDQEKVTHTFLMLMTAQVIAGEGIITKKNFVGTCFIMGNPLHVFYMGEE